MPTILEVRELCAESHSWEVGGWRVNALEHVSFQVREGEIVVILGPPRAGKTMLFHVILGLLGAWTGEVKIFGLPPSDWMWKSEVGYLPQSFCSQTSRSARAFLEHVAEGREILWGNKIYDHIGALLEQVGLSQFGDTSVSVFSKEMMLRLGVAQALVHCPRLIILDEPAEGLGRVGAEDLWKLLHGFRSRGGTVLLSARHGTELSADRLLVLEEGRVVPAEASYAFEETLSDETHSKPRSSDSAKTPEHNDGGSSFVGVRDFNLATRTFGQKAGIPGSTNR